VMLIFALALAACGTTKNKSSSSSSTPASTSSSSGSKTGAVGQLLPETKTTRYEAFDRPLFTQKLKALCPGCKLLYANANQDAATQQSQADSMLTQGVKVLVLDPVDGKAAQSIVSKAKARGIPVVSYDRLTNGPVNFYVSFDNVRVGTLQGQALVAAVKKNKDATKPIVMINGAPTDPNAAQFKKGALAAIKAGGLKIGKQYDTPDWSADKAQTEAQAAFTALNKNISGIYSANDGMAAGIAAAIQSAGISPFPPMTGQDAQIDGIQRIVAGQQYMTIYKAIKPEAYAAASMAVALLNGKPFPAANRTVNNGTLAVPSLLLTPVEVTRANIKQTVVADGFYTVKQICTKQYAAACKKVGLE
jgi:D-xylose transport system substrate-binding protein